MRRRVCSALLALLPAVLFAGVAGQQTSAPANAAQPPATAEALPPSEIYTQLLTPFNRVREDMANWSETELRAFQILVASAKQDCVRLEATPHEGDEELSLAQLCALGRDWDGTYSAARWYTRKDAPAEYQTHLPRGYALLLQADLNLQRRANAVDHLREMDERVPFSAETAAIFRFSVNAMEVPDLEHAVVTALLQQPRLLAAITGAPGSGGASAGDIEADAWHTLSLLHEAGQRETEAAEKAKLLVALQQRTATPTVVDRYRAQLGRRAYEWLGAPMPELHTMRRGTAADAPPRLRNGATLLVFETDGAPDVSALASGVESLRRRLPATQDAVLVVCRRIDPVGGESAPPAPVRHALYSSLGLAEMFGVDGAPLFLLRDTEGRIAFLGQGAASWLNPQMQAEMLLNRTVPEAAR